MICEGSEQQVFLNRNLSKRRRAEGVDDDITVAEALSECDVYNGLECKMACANFKVSYVLNTEDVLVRRKKRRFDTDKLGQLKERRTAAFRSWLVKKEAELGAAAPAAPTQGAHSDSAVEAAAALAGVVALTTGSQGLGGAPPAAP